MPELRGLVPRRRSLVLALLIAGLVMWLTGAIPRWGQWYGPEPHYRAQVAAFFEGRLALTDKPEGVTHDLAWIDGGVQQVWGLGVPAWNSIWEAIGRPFGLSPFPDRLAMMFAMVLMLYAMHRAWLGSTGDRSAASRGAFLFTAFLPGIITMLRGRVAVYEEAQAYAYGTNMMLLAGTLLMVRRPSRAMFLLLLGFAGLTGLVRPTVWFYGFASALLATPLYAMSRKSIRRALPTIILGWTLFVAGGAVLYGTNYVRFGRGNEFGHRLNLQDLPGNIYATRFEYPFEKIPATVAAKELVGALFGRPELKTPPGYHFYEKNLHVWQAPAPRWREYYFTAYSWAYLPLTLAGLILAIIAWLRVFRDDPEPDPKSDPKRDPKSDDTIISGARLMRESRWLGAWALIGTAPLLVFYLRSPAVSSRYFIDVGAGFSVLIVIFWRHLAAWLRPRGYATLALVAFVAWWGFCVLSSTSKRPWASPLRAKLALDTMLLREDPIVTARPLPAEYDLDDPWILEYVGGDQWRCPCFIDLYNEQACDHIAYSGVRADVDLMLNTEDHELTTRIHHANDPQCESGGAWPTACSDDDPDPVAPDALAPPDEYEGRTAEVPGALYRNGTNWDIMSGIVGVATYFFVDDPDYVEVEVAPADHVPLSEFTPLVRAKIELEELPLISTADTPTGVRLRFGRPKTEKYRHGLQILFLAFGPPEKLDEPNSDYKLLRVAWHDHQSK